MFFCYFFKRNNKNNMSDVVKVYSLEEIIDINERFDIHFSNLDTQSMLSLLETVQDKNLVDGVFKKGFKELYKTKKEKEAKWFFGIILPFVSFDAILNSIKDFGLKENLNNNIDISVIDILCEYLPAPVWRKICLDCKVYQILWFSQNIQRDVSFYWRTLNEDDIKKIINNFFLNPFSQNTHSLNFKTNLLAIFNRLPIEERVSKLKEQIMMMCNLLDGQSNFSLSVFLDMIEVIYTYEGVKGLDEWRELLNWLNANIKIKVYDTTKDFALKFTEDPAVKKCENYDSLYLVSQRFAVYYLKDIMDNSSNSCEDEPDEDELFKI